MLKDKKRIFLVFAMLALLCFLVAGVVAATGSSSPELVSLLWINPADPTIITGQSGSIELQLSDITGVFGVEIYMAFDPTYISVVGGAAATGTCPAPNFVAANSADNGAGTFIYVASQLNPTPPCDGGLVATLEFMCAPGLTSDVSTPITITGSIISDSDGTAIPHGVQDATVLCASSVFFVGGEVALQAWPHSPEGVHVELWNDTDGVLAGEVVVGADGLFAFAPEIDKSYSVTASYPRYLDMQQSGITSSTTGENIDLGTGALRVGDLNDDGVINILDLSVLAGNFLKSSPQTWVP
jgi:hypothetical protein